MRLVCSHTQREAQKDDPEDEQTLSKDKYKAKFAPSVSVASAPK